jgi:hypothetical protein
VNRVPSERPRFAPAPYDQLRQQVLRDRWRRQYSTSRNNLQVHHQRLRSQQGNDDDSNMITLCARCHELAAPGTITLIRSDA